ncbi:uncharacterized protein HaLaN_29777, partial [Haematococcus lacustris]
MANVVLHVVYTSARPYMLCTPPPQPLRILAPKGSELLFLAASLEQLTADTAVNVVTTYANARDILGIIMRGQANSSNPDDTVYDAVMDGALSFGDLARAGALVDLQPYIRDDPKQVMTIPFIEYPMIMYVNWPLLTSAPYNINWPVLGEAGRLSFYPDTWQELTAVMRQVNATASDPVTGKPRHALCLPVDYDLIFLTHAVMASIMQTAGPTQGWLFDPLTLEPLTNNTAMQQVLQVVWDLAPFLRTFDPAGSIDMTQCAIAISNPALFKSLNPMGANRQFMGGSGLVGSSSQVAPALCCLQAADHVHSARQHRGVGPQHHAAGALPPAPVQQPAHNT